MQTNKGYSDQIIRINLAAPNQGVASNAPQPAESKCENATERTRNQQI